MGGESISKRKIFYLIDVELKSHLTGYMRQKIFYILMLVSFALNAQTFRGGEIFRIGNSDIYWAAVKTSYFREYVVRQEEDCWCGAACIQMILLYNGESVSQSYIAAKVFGECYVMYMDVSTLSKRVLIRS